MKTVWKTIGSFLKFAFAVGVIIFVATLTYSFAQKVYPTQPLLQVMLLILFDAAALVWFVTFKDVADGTIQRAISGIMFFVSLLSIMLIVAAETITGTAAAMIGITVETLRAYATWAIVILAFLNASASYFFYLAHPKTLQRMREQYEQERAREHEEKMRDIDMDMREAVIKETEIAMLEEASSAGKAIAAALRDREMKNFYARLGVEKQANGRFILPGYEDVHKNGHVLTPNEPAP